MASGQYLLDIMRGEYTQRAHSPDRTVSSDNSPMKCIRARPNRLSETGYRYSLLDGMSIHL